MNNLRDVLGNLESEKIKERQEGLASIRTVFGRDEVIAKFHLRNGEADPRVWLPVFQALFRTILQEKRAFTKKGTTTKSVGSTATAQRRLADAASVVRWLTERTVHLMNKKVVTALFEHLIQTLVHQGEILAPVALDYIKALKCIVRHSSHLEHADNSIWVKIVEMGFNIVLGDPVETKLDDEEDMGEGGDDSEMDGVNNADDSDNHELPAAGSTSKKRRRVDTQPTPGPSKPSHRAKPRSNDIPVSLEQKEFASVISILLRSSTAPILCRASAILRRLQRFLELYPTDSSMLKDYLMTLSSTLEHLSLNKKSDVESFARATWNGLVGLWGTKDKRMKEGLIVVLRILFPFISSADESNRKHKGNGFDPAEGIGRLWHLLSGEADSRRGVDCLPLDALRLELLDPYEESRNEGTFVAKTFRFGWNFDSGQALSWAALELQADCAAKLYHLSESMHSTSTPSATRPESKRTKLENPITPLLDSMHTQCASHIRTYRLQILLFFIDRHWSIVHDALKNDILNTLLQFVTFDDGMVQSWVFLNFAAIASAESSQTSLDKPASSIPPTSPLGVKALDSSTWDPIWTHAIRRANVPTICRAACHAAQSLLSAFHPQFNSNHITLTSQRVLLEIETLAKDMDVQGPSYPFDSVCIFLSRCLRIASQDVRLYRMQLEEKVLSWLVDSWKINGDDKGKMSLHAVKDVMLLLENICGVPKRTSLISKALLPQCKIVESMLAEGRAKVIKDFLLFATLPPFRKRSERPKARGRLTPDNTVGSQTVSSSLHYDTQRVPPRGRERRISAFLTKALESLVAEWESIRNNRNHPTAEFARQSLDMAMVALAFESLLLFNGTTSNRRVLQTAGKTISLIIPLSKESRWTIREKSFLLVSLESLIHREEQRSPSDWEPMLEPDAGTGIQRQILRELSDDRLARQQVIELERTDFLRVIWQNPDTQDILADIANTLRDVLKSMIGKQLTKFKDNDMDVDDKDGFGPIRTGASQTSSNSPQQEENDRPTLGLLRICIEFLTHGPRLQSPSMDATRDKDLTQLILESANADPEKFVLVCPILLDEVRHGMISFSAKDLDGFLMSIGDLLQNYAFSRNEGLQSLVIQLLDSTLALWTLPSVASSELGDRVRELCKWISGLSGALGKRTIAAWTIRDQLAKFLDRYLVRDPTQTSWSAEKDDESCEPIALLPAMSADDDIRVRFRVAVINARLFVIAHHSGIPPLELYNTMKSYYSVDLDNYEHMLTRILALGNLMVVSSAVRRGPYWHLLEACMHAPNYSDHTEVVLIGVAARLGLKSLSVLFEAYASQLAFSILNARIDFLRLPPHLLGYRDRRQCAEAAFRAFTPTNVLTRGAKQFEGHCKIIQKSVSDGLRVCFGDIAGIQIVMWFNDHPDGSEDGLEQCLKQKTQDEVAFETLMKDNLDGIVASILRTLEDQDFDKHGPIFLALQSYDSTGRAVQTFQALTQYRSLDKFETHTPNLPAFPATNLLRSLTWLSSRVPADPDNKIPQATTYHVIHNLLADLQKTPFLNEQLRIINALSLWISIRSSDFKEATILHALVHGATLLLAQSDLARSAQSILEWAFNYYRKLKTKDSRLPNALIRIASLANDYSLNSHDKLVADMGIELLQWIDEQMLLFSKGTTFTSVILKALSAWPNQPCSQLSQLYSSVSAEKISAVLSEPGTTSNRFRLVRRLHEHAVSMRYKQLSFAKTDFWWLKEFIPSLDRLQEEDVKAFSELLVLNHGQIVTLGTEQPVVHSIRHEHITKVVKRRSTEDPPIIARKSIILGLLMMLQGDAPAHVHTAYTTLRLIMAALPEGIIVNLPDEYQTELKFLQEYRQPPVTRPTHDLRELTSSEVYMTATKDFSQWIGMFTVLLSDILSIEDATFAQLTSILKADVSFAEQVLPILVHRLLQVEIRDGNSASQALHRTILSEYFTSILSYDQASTRCLFSIIDIILYLRYFFPRPHDGLSNNKWLDVNFLLLSRKAILCGLFTTALLFLELASEDAPLEGTTSEQILYEIYAHIDEPDGFYGIKTQDLHQFLIKRFHHEKQWEKAFRFHGAALEAGNRRLGEGEGLVQSFHSFGFNQLAIDTMQNSHSSTEAPSTGMSYRLGWRTETWDLPYHEEHAAGGPLYSSLRAVYRERDPSVVDGTVRSALYQELSRLRALGSENVVEIREVARDLMCLSQVARWRSTLIQGQLESRNIDVGQWTQFTHIDEGFEFSDLESLMATRMCLVRSARLREQGQQIGSLMTPLALGLAEIEKTCLLRLSEAAREAGQSQIALNSIIRAQGMDTKPSFAVSQEFANVLWLQKEERLAVQYLQNLVFASDVNNGSQDIPDSRRALLLARLGAWTSEACLEKPTEIWSRFFEPAIVLLGEANSRSNERDHAIVYHECAIFAERQYHATLKSPDAIRWKVYVDRKKEEIQHRSMELARLTDATRHQKLKNDQETAQKLLQADSELFKKHNIVRDTFLKQAIDMYSRCLEASDAFDSDSAIRLCSLWFANFDDDVVLEATVRKALERTPSRKLVFLAHQLTARLAKSPQQSKNQESLQRLVLRMCQEHPFHSLYQVYCLRPERSAAPEGRRQSGRHATPSTQTERGTAASDILDQLRGTDIIGDRVRDVEKLCDACLQWAKFPISKDPRYKNDVKPKGGFKVPDDLLIRQISKLQVPVTTCHTPLDLTMLYNDCIWIERYETKFDTAGGINLPKITECYGSDGKRYKQLFKGNDDLRQDAVMEQVFELVNSVLHRDRETRRRELSVRGYRVIPLSTQAGLLEFVGNTSPLREWLNRAHQSYRPQDTKQNVILSQLREAQATKRTERQLETFLKIRENFKPVMRHYFTEKHRNPVTWFAMRLKYIRSVATTSIVGHILGLGDRHTSNILMDNGTGEVVHIDLGIAFEQGKLLPVPERVPFRMTADMVDGMGTSGTQGVFQRCAEETLRVLRDGSEVIMTVLEVFKHDPLHSWTASELKVRHAQRDAPTPSAYDTSRFNLGIGIDMSSGTAQESADRALSSVARKLDKGLSVESTVNELIAEATDPLNLATIFFGWCPHL